VLAIIAAGLAAYAGSFRGPFIFDDVPSIVENPTIRHLWPFPQKPFVFHGETVAGRPLLNFTFAINYVLGELDVRGYHAANLLIHILAALTLFGILRRTLQGLDGGRRTVDGRANAEGVGGYAERGSEFARGAPAASSCAVRRPPSTLLAFAITLLWLLHPLQTESVTYIVQRAESLGGLFYLLTLYCVIRGAATERGWWLRRTDGKEPSDDASVRRSWISNSLTWYCLAILACVLGVASKEVVATAPVVVFLYDRTFLTGSFRQAWRRRRGLYVGLAATWVPLAVFLIGTRGRGESVGFGYGVTSWEYALTQCMAIARYLRLSLWPAGLCLDYGVPVARTPGEILPGALLLAILAAATLWALLRRPALGFLGAFFLAMLAPTSSFVPIATQTIAEHRMYLGLAAVIAAAVSAADVLLYRLLRLLRATEKRQAVLRPAIAAMLVAGAALAFGEATRLRNEEYRTELSIWESVVRNRPQNARGYNSLGCFRYEHGQFDAAIDYYRKGLEVDPNYPDTRNNLGAVLVKCGRFAEAIVYCQKTVELKPGYAEAHCNLGAALAGCGRFADAIAQYQIALEIDPDYAEAHANLGSALASQGQVDAAIAQFEKAAEIKPRYAEAHYDLGNCLFGRGQTDAAIAHYEKALEIRPNYAEAHSNLGAVLASRGQADAAIDHYRKALQINPDYADAHNNFGNLLARRRQFDEAIDHYRKALTINPEFATTYNNLGNALAGCGRLDEAISHYRKALEMHPDDARARRNLSLVAADREEILKRLSMRRETLQSRPNDPALLNDTAWMLATDPNASIRNGAEAVELAGRAMKLSGGKEPTILGTLAAAYAEAGRFAEAVQTAEQAVRLAEAAGGRALAEQIRLRLDQYRSGKPYRQRSGR
jgi:tetratricopeptide (TPR) repeat protein